jgi:hypothetical protein
MAVTIRRLISPTDWQNRQINTLKAVGEANYRVGVTTPKKDPIAAGIAAEGKWANAMQRAIQDGTRAKNLGETTAAEWESYATNIGAGRLVDGVVRRQAKISNFLQAYVPELTNILGTIDQMPTATASDRNGKSRH